MKATIVSGFFSALTGVVLSVVGWNFTTWMFWAVLLPAVLVINFTTHLVLKK